MSQSSTRQGHSASGKQARLVIPVKVVGSRLEFAYGRRLPKLADGAPAELVVDADAVSDKYLVKLLQSEQVVDLLSPGESILIELRADPIREDLLRRAFVPDRRLIGSGVRYVEATLKTALRLRLSGARRGAFTGGACSVPALDGREAISLNQAFTFISEVYETERQSHVGNAFLRGLFLNPATHAWSRLDDLRRAYEARYEEYLTQQFAVDRRRKEIVDPPTFAEWLDGRRIQMSMKF